MSIALPMTLLRLIFIFPHFSYITTIISPVNFFLLFDQVQGAFALCRIVKRNEQKPTRVGVGGSSGSGSPNVDSTRNSNEPFTTTSGDICQTSYSSPITSPQMQQPFETVPVSIDTNPASVWVSPDLILDSSKVLEIWNLESSVCRFL